MKNIKIKFLKIWNNGICFIIGTMLTSIAFIPEILIFIFLINYFNEPFILIIFCVFILLKAKLIVNEVIISKRINDYFIMYDIKWLNLYMLFQKVDKKKIMTKDCETKYKELRNMTDSFDLSILNPKRNYITVTHNTVMQSLKKIPGINIKKKIYLYTQNLDKIQFQIFLCKNKSNNCRIRRARILKRKFYFVKFKYYEKGAE
jgi:hypothetical protein